MCRIIYITARLSLVGDGHTEVSMKNTDMTDNRNEGQKWHKEMKRSECFKASPATPCLHMEKPALMGNLKKATDNIATMFLHFINTSPTDAYKNVKTR
jgi:hypothetical protein